MDRKRPGLKRKDITPCLVCGEGIAKAGPIFYRVGIEQMALDTNAIQREHGLEQMMGGNVAIAMALSPDPDLGVSLTEPTRGLVCMDCGTLHPMMLALDDGKDREDD